MKTVIGMVLIGLCLAHAPLAWGGTTGKITGTVKDAQSGEPLIGVNVFLQGTSLGAATGVDGSYVILNIPPGKYTVVASAVGYSKKTVEGLGVSIDLTTTLDFQLSTQVLEIGKEVVITAERPVIKKDLTSSEARVDASQIKALPVSEVTEVLSLQSGITVDRGGGIHIRGGRTSEVAYWVDGVSVSDVYDGGQAVQVDNNSVQELQVISGTFNAEYGQAMSGIVNIVTKDGQSDYHGSISAYVGDFATTDAGTNDNLSVPFVPGVPPNVLSNYTFYNLNAFRPFNNKNVEASLSGPLGDKNLTFYLAGRYFKSDGWLYGNNVFLPSGAIDLSTVHLTQGANGQPDIVIGDNPVAMNGRERLSGQAKLTYQFSGIGKLSVTGVGSKIDYRDYNHAWELNPTGDVNKYDRGYDVSAIWSHTLSPASFYTLNVSYFFKGFKEYLYENPFDTRYYTDPFLQNTAANEFIHGGTNLHHFKRMTETRLAKLDYTSQISKLHEMKAGIEGKLHRLYLEDYYLIPDSINHLLPAIPLATGNAYQEYTEKPVEFSAYIQDKLEYDRMIVNVGIRYDYFNSNGKMLADPRDPNVYLPVLPENKALTLPQRLAKWYTNASAKGNVSPRIGISYPITDRGIMHFSYGHFLQIPSFIYLYQNPGYKVSTASGLQGVYGNPDLNPQKTVQYELGLQQQLNDQLSFDLTMFYRDTRDWVTTGAQYPVGGDYNTASTYYTVYVNRDYANTRGVTLSVTKRPSQLLSLNIAYTYQVAEGINSNPDDFQAAQAQNKEPALSLTPLDWDQTHTVNATVGLGETDWGVVLLGRYGSGLPYTPVINQATAQGQDVSKGVQNNSRRQPPTYTIDLRTFKNLKLSGLNMSVFLKIFNLLDTRNETSVYGQTGRASATLRALGLENVSTFGLVNPLQEYINRPDFYSAPREIQFGMELEF
jgi:outer membrane receptor protein involved in Fe transport